MKRTEECPNALKATTATGVFEMLQSNNASLEKIQKALEVNNTGHFDHSGIFGKVMLLIRNWPMVLLVFIGERTQ